MQFVKFIAKVVRVIVDWEEIRSLVWSQSRIMFFQLSQVSRDVNAFLQLLGMCLPLLCYIYAFMSQGNRSICKYLYTVHSCIDVTAGVGSLSQTCSHFCIFREPSYILTYIPKHSCRNKIVTAREPNICSLNLFWSRHKLIQRSVQCKCWFLNFICVLDHF